MSYAKWARWTSTAASCGLGAWMAASVASPQNAPLRPLALASPGTGLAFSSRSSLPSASTAYMVKNGILAANAAVYGTWLFMDSGMAMRTSPKLHVRLHHILHKYFLSDLYSHRAGSRGLLQVLGSSFSHSTFFHILANMFALNSFTGAVLWGGRGPSTPSAPKLSGPEYLAMYLAAGAVGGYASSVFSYMNRIHIPSLGASGAVFAVLAYWALSYPEGRVSLFFVLDMESWQFLPASVLVNLALAYRMRSVARSGGGGLMIDGVAHLGGTAVGAAAYALKHATHPQMVLYPQGEGRRIVRPRRTGGGGGVDV